MAVGSAAAPAAGSGSDAPATAGPAEPSSVPTQSGDPQPGQATPAVDEPPTAPPASDAVADAAPPASTQAPQPAESGENRPPTGESTAGDAGDPDRPVDHHERATAAVDGHPEQLAPVAGHPQDAQGGRSAEVPSLTESSASDAAVLEGSEPTPATLPSPAEPADPAKADAAEPDVDPASGPSGRRSALRGLAPAVVLALLTVLVVLTGYLGWQLYRDNQVANARQQGTLAARDAARLLFSYDYNRLDQDFAAGLAVTTGPFRDQYEKTTSTVVKPVAQQYQAVVKADVREAGVVQASPGRVVVIVFVNQTTTSTRVTGPRVDQSRVRMTLKNQGGKWLVEQVDAL